MCLWVFEYKHERNQNVSIEEHTLDRKTVGCLALLLAKNRRLQSI